MMTAPEEYIWSLIARDADRFILATNSDLFQLLATILAYYQVRGTSPEEMIASPRLKEIEQADGWQRHEPDGSFSLTLRGARRL